MKWFLVLGIVACLLFAGVVWAEEVPNIPEGFTPEEYALLLSVLGMGPDDSTNHVDTNISGGYCIYDKGAWVKLDGYYNFSCNKRAADPVDVTVHASIAQWLTFKLDDTEFWWYVLKPGTYDTTKSQLGKPYGLYLFGTLTSNGNIELKFDGFEDLKSSDLSNLKKIPAQYRYDYCYGSGPWVSGIFVPATNFNQTLNITEPLNGYSFRIYSKITVNSDIPACEYEDCAKIYATLKEQKTWVCS